jgi:hypothetical protein
MTEHGSRVGDPRMPRLHLKRDEMRMMKTEKEKEGINELKEVKEGEKPMEHVFFYCTVFNRIWSRVFCFSADCCLETCFLMLRGRL